MATLIKKIRNDQKVIFDQGKFDAWCVFVVNSNGSMFAPLDVNYFTDLQKMASKYTIDKIYNDFVNIYDQTTSRISEDVLNLIDEIIDSYKEEDKEIMEQWFAVIYGGMIAEENKERAILKKRVKRLGIHQILILNTTPEYAANFSKGKKWRELDSIMKEYGF